MPNPNGTLTAAEIDAKNLAANENNPGNKGLKTNTGVYEPGVINNMTPPGGVVYSGQAVATKNADGSTSYNSAPVGTSTTPAVGSAGSVLGTDNSFVNQYAQDQLNTYNTPINENDIYAQKLADRQAQIDATKKIYADQLNQARIQGQGRIGSSTAAQARGGLLGSDFGTAQTNNIQDANTGIQNSINNEQDAAIQSILTGVRNDAVAELATKTAAKKAGGEAYYNYVTQTQPQMKATKIDNAVKQLIANGIDPSSIADSELTNAGISRNEITAAYNTAKAAATAAAAKTALDTSKTQSEIDQNNANIKKLQQDVANGQLDQNKYYEVGNKIYERGTNKFISDAVFNPNNPFQVTQGNAVFTPDGKGGGSFSTPPASGFRTDRNNNPTAMTTDVAKSLGLVEGVDYVRGDVFPNNPNLFTAKILGDGIQTTIKALDAAAQNPSMNAFTTQGGQPRWTYINMTDQQWQSMSPEQKMATVNQMYKNEGGSGTLGGGGVSPQAQDIIKQINQNGGKPQDYILGTGADSQKLLQEVITGLNNQGGTGTLASDTRTQSLNLASKTIDDLLAKKDLAGSPPVRSGVMNVLQYGFSANEATDFKNRVDALAGQLLQIDGPTLKAMFGPQISNSDVEAIKKTILQGLDPENQTPAAFERTLQDVKNKMQAYISRLPSNGTTSNTAPSGLTYTVN